MSSVFRVLVLTVLVQCNVMRFINLRVTTYLLTLSNNVLLTYLYLDFYHK